MRKTHGKFDFIVKKLLLTLKRKLELPITEMFEKGESVKKLANDYGIVFRTETLKRIKKN